MRGEEKGALWVIAFLVILDVILIALLVAKLIEGEAA